MHEDTDIETHRVYIHWHLGKIILPVIQ